jgi:hypothetical protein
MWPGRDTENFQERSADHNSSTYPVRAVGAEGRIMDDSSSSTNVDCPSMLKWYVARRDIEKIQETSADHHSSTYPVSAVGVKGRIMDGKISITNVDCPSTLKVACPPPGIGAKI